MLFVILTSADHCFLFLRKERLTMEASTLLTAVTNTYQNTSAFDTDTTQFSHDYDTGTLASDDSCNISNMLYGIMATVGVMDNAFVLFVIFRCKHMQKHINNLYFIHQFVIDLMSSVLLLCTIPLCRETNQFVCISTISGQLYCSLLKSKLFFWVCVPASSYNLVGLTLDSYMAIIHAIWYKNTITRMTTYVAFGLAWTISAG